MESSTNVTIIIVAAILGACLMMFRKVVARFLSRHQVVTYCALALMLLALAVLTLGSLFFIVSAYFF